MELIIYFLNLFLKNLAEKLGIGFVETSAKNCENVAEAFMTITGKVISNFPKKKKKSSVYGRSKNNIMNFESIPVNKTLNNSNCNCNLM